MERGKEELGLISPKHHAILTAFCTRKTKLYSKKGCRDGFKEEQSLKAGNKDLPTAFPEVVCFSIAPVLESCQQHYVVNGILEKEQVKGRLFYVAT